MAPPAGIVAAGHPQTARVAREVLDSGGNAFDAVVAAHFAACVCEPTLASLGGGGFLLAQEANGNSVLYDFFAHTPQIIRGGEIDFFPIAGDFGSTVQEFHIGMASAAVPGTVKGLFAICSDLCRMSPRELAEPAVVLANKGVVVNSFQAYISRILEPIITARPEIRKLFSSHGGSILTAGQTMKMCDLADCFEGLVSEGEALFYHGEIGARIADLSRQHGGHLTSQDLNAYQVVRRDPLWMDYHGAQVMTNPAPSCGGTLVAHTLSVLQHLSRSGWHNTHPQYRRALADVMAATNEARRGFGFDYHPDLRTQSQLLESVYLRELAQTLENHTLSSRGTTHISVADRKGNIASMTVSNGEGNGYVIPGTDIVLNNMLGEEDLSPLGFDRLKPNTRLSSMMAPTVIDATDGSRIALGSGGSNRIRSAIVQVLVALLDFGESLDAAIDHPRQHYEKGLLSLESGFDSDVHAALSTMPGEIDFWDQQNLFFGGVHGVRIFPDGTLEGSADARRGGAVA